MARRGVLRQAAGATLACVVASAFGRADAARASGGEQAAALSGISTASGTTWRVGHLPGALVRIEDAAARAQDGDVVEIEAGEYRGDVAVWQQRRLVIRAVGGPVRLVADGRSAEDKAIWVIRDGVFDISGIEFDGARVPHNNGAGIRFERGRLSLRDCRFLRDELGLLTSNDPGADLRIQSCEFTDNG